MRAGADYFLEPAEAVQRRYEALRCYFVDEASAEGNYFLNAIGELVQRMIDPNAEHGLAFPDVPRIAV